MQKHMFGLRGLLAAIVIIVLSTGAAAAASSHAAQGLATAAEKAGKTVPVAAQEETNEDEETEEAPETEPEEESSEDSEHCATDPTDPDLDPAVLAELNHGAIVCWAAHQETPAEFDNHGAWVKSWAKDNHGHEEAADAASASESHGKPDGVGKPNK